MALSNWDTYAVGFEIVRTYAPKKVQKALQAEARERRVNGEDPQVVSDWYAEAIGKHQDLTVKTFSSDGSYSSNIGVTADIYKNWIYLRSPSLWREGCGYVEPTIGEFNEGRIKIGGLELTAWRGPQHGIYALVEEYIYSEPQDDEPWLTTRRGMLAVGCSGYEDFAVPRSWKRVQVATCFNDECEWVLPLEGRDYRRDDYPKSCPECNDNTQLSDFEPTGNDTYSWCGVKSSSLRWFEHKLRLEIADEGLDQVDLMAGKRYNQGDAFFAGHFGIDTPTTNPEEAEEPMITEAIKGMNKRMPEDE